MEYPPVISLDHDLGKDEEGALRPTGLDCIKWLKEYCLDNKIRFVSLVGYHTSNLQGGLNMKSIIDGLTTATRFYE